MSYQGVFFNCTFGFWSAEVGPEILHYSQPGDADAAWSRNPTWNSQAVDWRQQTTAGAKPTPAPVLYGS